MTTKLAHLQRTLLPALLCTALSACVGISTKRTTDLPEAPGVQALPVPVAFIVHLQPLDPNPIDPRFSGAQREREAEAWVAALSPYAEKRHIYVAVNDNPHNMPAEMQEFGRTHPVVEISDGDDPAHTKSYIPLRNFGATVIDLSTLGFVQLPLSFPYAAHFTLNLPAAQNTPEGAQAQTVTREYDFERRATPRPLYPIPNGDDYVGFYVVPMPGSCPDCAGAFAIALSDWRVREKRKLVAHFLRDMRPQLEQFARRAAEQDSRD